MEHFYIESVKYICKLTTYNMRTIINTPYIGYSEDIRNILNSKCKPSAIIKDSRNKINRYNINGLDCVVKKFKKPVVFNMIMYSFFRKSKARRAYENALKLLDFKIETNYPIAYCQERKNGLFHTGYYIYKWLPYNLVDNVSKLDIDEKHNILDQLAKFTVSMHKKGIFFYDYNCANIMYHCEGEKIEFALLDINRIKFYKSSLNRAKCVTVLKHMTLQDEDLIYFLREYAKLRGWEEKILMGAVLLEQGLNPLVRFRKFIKKTFINE